MTLDTVGHVLLCVLIGVLISIVIYLAIWTPKKRMKGYAGRGKCKCKSCSKYE
jgi:hypothetical protein